jgi:signal transduction histidine kinase
MIFHPLLFSQTRTIDSLKEVIASLPENHEKADNLILLARLYLNIDKDSLSKYGDDALALAKKLNYWKATAEADIIVGKGFSLHGDNQQAMVYYKKALTIADSLNDSANIAKATFNIGSVLSAMSEFQEALEYLGKSYTLYDALNDSVGLLGSLNNKGIVFSRISAYDSAAFYYSKAILLCEAAKKEYYLMMMYNNLGDIYLQLGQLDNARKYVLRSKEISERKSNKSEEASSYNYLGRIDAEAGNFNDALINYRHAEKLYSQILDNFHKYDVYNNIGVLYADRDDFQNASRYYALALKGYREIDNKKGIIVVLGNQSALVSDQGRYLEALAINDTVLSMATRYGYDKYRKDALWNISDNYSKLGNYRKAYDYRVLFYNLRDSIYTLEKDRLVNELMFKYEKQKDQARILSLQNENLVKDLRLKKEKLQRNALLYTCLTVFFIGVFVFLYFHQRRIKDRIITAQKIRQLEEEKKLMSAKLLVEGQDEERKRIATELHDGLGVLLSATKMQFSTIKDRSPENQELINRAAKMLEEASGDVRRISHNMMPGLLTRLGFYEAIEDLFEHVDDTGRLRAICEIIGDRSRLPENSEIMLYRIVQEMVNNTLKHAKASAIRLRIDVLPGMLDLIYTDDGIGFDYEKKIESGSPGLKNIQSRVNFLNGKLQFSSSPGEGVKYSILVPLADS